MATISAPNAALFDSDPLEQIYAKGTLMPNMAGLANLMLFAERQRIDQGREQYLGALGQTQALENMMGQRKIAADLQGKRMDNTRHLAEKGYLPGSMHGGDDLFSDVGAGDAFARLLQEEIRSKIFSNMQSGSGGGGNKDQVTEDRTVFVKDSNGNLQAVTVKSRSADPMRAVANAEAALRGRQPFNNKGDSMQAELERRHRENTRNPGIRD